MLAMKIKTLLLSLLASLAYAEQRPNIIVILSDDMGYSDIGCFGGEIQTPNLNKLAANGVRFTQFYNAARCCPTRASLLTGLYPHQAGMGGMTDDRGVEGYRGDLNEHCVSIAQVLKPAGYVTYCIGKWHVTPPPLLHQPYSTKNWPLQRGFDHFYGIIYGVTSYWDPHSLVRQNQLITCKNDPEYQPTEPYHFTDAITDNTVRYIEEHEDTKPMFMYVAYMAGHWPLHARERDIKKYDGVYDAGYDAIRRKRYKRMKELGVIDDSVRLSETAGDWSDVADKSAESALMETYAAMVDQMDQGIGRIVAALKQKGQLDNTLILFLQDNGACHEDMHWIDCRVVGPRAAAPSMPPIPDDVMHYDDGVPKQTRDGWPVLFDQVKPGPADTYFAYGQAWANVSNTPFRLYKHWVHEGGTTTPLIAHWPAGIKAKNELRKEVGHIVDIMATCVDVSGAQYPTNLKEEAIRPMEGQSLMAAIEGRPFERESLIWSHAGSRALRVGDWKLVAAGRTGAWELYNLKEDRSEMNDVADTHPERLQKMIEQFNSEARRTNIAGGKKVAL